MKRFKSFLAMILCLTMLLSTLPMSVFAVDTVNRTADSIEINVGETKTIECKDGNIVYLFFKPVISGVYTFYSISNSDTYGYLYDASKTQITQNDDGGEGRNFSITYDLIGGEEYYWGAKFYSSSASGMFEIALTCDHEHINTVDDGGKVATCTEDGYTAGIYCNDCNKWLYGHEEIKASHTDVNEDIICDVCGNNVPIATGTAGTNIIWNLYSNGHLELLGFGSMSNYKDGSYRYGHSPWYSYMNDITSITIQEGITSIGNAAFYGCDIESITIPDSVRTIGVNAFEYCNVLKEIDFGNGVTTIGSDAFYKCTALTSVVLPDSVTTIDGSFNFCENLRTVSFGKGLRSIGSLSFQHCALEYLSLPASVTNIDEHAFIYCYNLTNISVDKNNQYFSSDEYGVLFNKDKTKLIKYPVGNRREYYAIPEGVVSIEYQAFMGSGGISGIIIGGGTNPDINVEEFEECSVLKEIVIPNSVQIIGESAFEYCALLQDLTLPNSIENIGDYAFYGCDSLTNVTLPNSVTDIGKYAFASCDNLVNVSLSNSLTDIGADIFSNCKSLTNVIIPDGVTSIPDSMFYLCTALTKIVIPKSVTKIYGYAFYGCNAFKDVYYTGTEEEWKKISITTRDSSNFQVNQPLLNATIHYNYHNEGIDKEEDKIVSKIKYGADRLSFGVGITGYVGDVVDSLVVYTSANENIASLDITSSNTDIVEIGTIEIGVGDYITSENEHMATIPLKLKAEGTSTITITSPEGVSESVKVTVTADPISDFNAVTYVADKWLDESDVHYPTIHNFMYNFKDPSYETIKILSTDKDFLASVAAWETANVINDPTQIADDMVNKQQYYEAILFSLLSTQFEEGSLTDYVKATEITKTYKFTKNFTKFVNSIEGIDSHNILTKTLTESEKALISNDLKSLNSSQLLEGLSSCEILIDILDYSKDIEEFVNVCGKYLTLLEVQSSTEKLLDTMYELCEVNLLSDADRVCLKEALRCVKNACNSQFGVMLAGIEKGTTQVLQWTADAMCAEMWKTLCSSNVYVLCLKAGLSVGITISNTVFSTDKTIAQYYSMLCLNDVRQLVNQAAIKLGQDYKASRSQEDAEAYISAVEFVFDSYLLGCNYAVDFQKIVRKDSLAGKILFKNDNSFESFKKQAESLENEVSLNYTLLQKQWCYNLLDDYPELFDAVAEEIDLQFYANLEHSSIRVDGLSFDYTGTEITPNITVVMNGEKLVLDKDFTVSYSNNVNPGVANIEVTGIGDYHGTNTATFNINEQWFDKKIDIRNNGRATLMRAFNLRSISTVSNENSTEAPISIHVYDGDKEVALIENGEIVKADIQIIVYGDRITLLMDDKDYRIVVNADQNTNIDYSYNEYDKELILTKTANYNNTILTSTTALTQTTGTDTVMCGNNALTPTYSTLNQNNERYSISVIGGAASSKEASQGEWVSIAAIAPDGYKFVEWQASTDVGLLDKNSANTSFIMSDFDVELAAVFEEELLADISGTITSFGNNEDSLTIKLLQGSIEIDSVQTTDNSYLFEGVASGTYTLEVSKADHVTRTYEITVTDEDVVQNVKIHLLGDITGDGKVNTSDVAKANAHAKKTSMLSGYEFACADINGDGKVNTSDVAKANAHAKKTSLLW